MTDRSDALRLADELEYASGNMRSLAHQAAAELRRLHAENEQLREAARMALDMLEQWDGLIKHQYTGSAAAMTDMHLAAQATVPVLEALRAALGESNE